ncbi:penicillin-binding protein 2 [Flavisphingomonas formosensis]|uniref:penicillin-binding protein 2 n=1 Tax=Flavisphingomonas formosensis TaxID=861534 RepID=UPI0012F75653|nr:penicillin-binding protein 2 [Sphingomonas formosensis]
MKRSGRIITDSAQAYSFSRRAMLLGGIQAGVATLLGARMAWLSVAENAKYRTLAESNRVQLVLIPPRRGWIIDRYGKPIAINRTDFRVDLIPDQLHDADRVIAALKSILALPDDEIDRIREDLAKAAGYQPVQVADDLDYEHYAAISVRLPELPGVAPAQGYSRYYPTGASVGHLVGYVGAPSAKDYERTRDPVLITPGYKVGKEGLEKTMEDRLKGQPGAKRTEVTARGKLVRELTTRPEVVGKTLRLTVDAGLQDYAARRLGTDSGSAIVLDCLTGDILAMASMPAYDPNSFSDGISHMEWEMLSTNDHHPLINKTLQGLYPPGSTVKPMNALALLSAGVTPEDTVQCSGSYRVGNGIFHCWSRRGHGSVNMRKAIYQSCDIYFYHMSRQVGIAPIANMMRELGLGAEYPLPVASQRYGTVPDAEWKKRKYKTDWSIYDTINASIGQGYVLANPLQLAVMAARIASGRKVVPRLLLDHPHEEAPLLGIPQDHLLTVHGAMSDVVNSGLGTGGRAKMNVPGVLLAGKTGTAQVRRITMAERKRGVLGDAALPFRLRDHSLFVCFAPVDNPRYACSVVLEHSGHISIGAPIAKDILTYLYDKDQALKSLAKLEEGWGGDVNARMTRQYAEWKAAKAAPAAPTATATAAAAPAAPPPAAAAPAAAKPAAPAPAQPAPAPEVDD